ncbi:MFS transporter [Cellulomonas sp. zg-ZUI199]|uniref:MFS transporter n=1 Tax=Cellulomonas wangleii TaxID=2816956 RepID=A0ABX8D825_9CELL|nr:MFS transporter [Cellulomonas wangleii]MBO0926698.1 MFS transporter [Cellulomonas wangleii]QVI63183.1 MFS transporter [Cellulomonas wangleii]
MSTTTPSYTTTRHSAHVAYVVQAVVNNLAPLLFVVFHTALDVPVAQLGALAALNFGVQLLTDLVAVRVVDRIGYRRPMVAAHALAALGLVLLAVLPFVLPAPFVGLCVAVVVYGIGGGLLEVLVSPVVEHLPQPEEAKAAGMAFAHSFYCWGQLAVVVLSTALLAVVGSDLWPLLPVLWAVVPLVNLVVLLRVPMPPTVPDEHRTSLRSLFGTPLFLAALVLMATGGAAELTMAQWSSFFAEQGTGVPKEVGDLLGPGLFALLMGLGRVAYGLWGQGVPLRPLLAASGVATAVCYVVAATAAVPVVSLVACALCGLTTALLWPGTFSLTSARFPLGGAAMFAVLALAGDAGGTFGPLGVGLFADLAAGPLAGIAAALPPDTGTGLRVGMLLSAAVPAVFALTVLASGRERTAA